MQDGGEPEEVSLCPDVGGDVGEAVLRSMTEVEHYGGVTGRLRIGCEVCVAGGKGGAC